MVVSKTPLRVHHANLERSDPESVFRSWCPHCKDGILMVWRNQNDLRKLLRLDTCVLCREQVWYLDESIGGAPFTEGDATTAWDLLFK